MTSLCCNGKKLVPFEFYDADAEAKKDALSDFPMVSATAIETDNSDVSD